MMFIMIMMLKVIMMFMITMFRVFLASVTPAQTWERQIGPRFGQEGLRQLPFLQETLDPHLSTNMYPTASFTDNQSA